MTNTEMETAIKWIKSVKAMDVQIMDELKKRGYTETEIRYCYVLATGKNMTI